MISKKQRKASRFYNCVVRKAEGFQRRKKSVTLRAKPPKTAKPAPAVIRIPTAPREQRTQKQTRLGFIPKVAAIFKTLFSRKAA